MTIEMQQTSKKPVEQTVIIKLALEALPKATKEVEAMREEALKDFTAVFSQPLVEVKEKNNGVPNAEGATITEAAKDNTKQDLAKLKDNYDKQGIELADARAKVVTFNQQIEEVRREFSEAKSKHQDDLTYEKNKTTKAENQLIDLNNNLVDANDKVQIAQKNLEESKCEHKETEIKLTTAEFAEGKANKDNQRLRRQVNDLLIALDKTKTATDSPVVTPAAPPPVTIAVTVDKAKVRKDLAEVDMMVSQIKEPAWRRYAGAKLVGTVVSAAGVIAGGVGSLAMGLDPSLGVAACLAAPVIKFTIDKICSGWRTGSYQATLNKAISKASGAGSWIEQLANTKALINIVNKFASPNTKEQQGVLKKLTVEAERITAKITEQKSFERRTDEEEFPVYQLDIQRLKGAGGGWPLVMDLTFYAGTIGSIGLFSGEMVSFGNRITSWIDQVYRFFV
ncbi:MAG: hypothetical protein NTV65_07600 [Proteobacteria bacterium]|nr:hypothetical protein [Pseudomonadota bacterium]